MPAPKRWKCTVCGYEHEGDAPPDTCPVCGADADMFELQEDEVPPPADDAPALDRYLSEWQRQDDGFEQKYVRIRHLAITGESEYTAMRSQRPYPDWDTILFKGVQLARMPLNDDEAVSSATVIGKTAQKPMELSMPFYVSHMSFGALSREAKIALAQGANAVGTVMCSGEGGMLPEERAAAGLYIYEFASDKVTHDDAAALRADAVELKIGQAAKPGLGGYLPAEKVTEEIAKVRGIPVGQAKESPGRYAGMDSIADLVAEVARLKKLTGGKPIGIKIAAGHIEEDLKCALEAAPDFITLDCRAGGTGAAPVYVKDNVCIPAIFALRRARKVLDAAGSQATLCVTGGFRDSADIAKALALGADAVALATASLVAIGCQQYRICHSNKCPVGVTTQDPELRKRFDIEASTRRFVNFYNATRRELENLARLNGRDNVHALDLSDVLTTSHEVTGYTDIEHV